MQKLILKSRKKGEISFVITVLKLENLHRKSTTKNSCWKMVQMLKFGTVLFLPQQLKN